MPELIRYGARIRFIQQHQVQQKVSLHGTQVTAAIGERGVRHIQQCVQLPAANLPGRRQAGAQQRLAGELQDLDILPDVSDLPESMNEAEFRRRFGGPGTPAYRRMMDEIEGRLDATPLFR